MTLEPEKDCRAEEKGRRESVAQYRRQECAWSRESLRERASGSAEGALMFLPKGPALSRLLCSHWEVHVVFKCTSAWPHSYSVSKSWLRTGRPRRVMRRAESRVTVGEEGRGQTGASCLRQNSQGSHLPWVQPMVYINIGFFLNV